MSTSNPQAEQEALALLKALRTRVGSGESFSPEVRKQIADSWATIYDFGAAKPIDEPFPGKVFPIFDPGDLDPSQALCMLALRTFGEAVAVGVPGAEYEAEVFLRERGFEEEEIRGILETMVTRSPDPDPESLS